MMFGYTRGRVPLYLVHKIEDKMPICVTGGIALKELAQLYLFYAYYKIMYI